MPTLETTAGKPVDASPIDPDAVAAQMQASLNDDGPDEQAPPRRQPAAAEAEKPKAKRGRPKKEDLSRTANGADAEVAPAPPSPEVTAKRAAAAEETFRLAGTCLLMAGQFTHMPSFTADGYVVNANANPVAVALADVAAVEPQIAKWLDKAPSAKVSAWMGLATVAAGLGLQAAANHKILKPGVMGTSDPADIIRVNEEAIAKQQKAAEEYAAEMQQEADAAQAEYEAEHADVAQAA